jgi:hypothetical protein
MSDADTTLPALFVPQIANYPSKEVIVAAEKAHDDFMHESFILVANKIAQYIDSLMSGPADKIDWNVEPKEFILFYVKLQSVNVMYNVMFNNSESRIPVKLHVTLQRKATYAVVCDITDCKFGDNDWKYDNEAQYDHYCRMLLEIIGKIFAPLSTVDVVSGRKCTIQFPLSSDVLK